MKKKGWEIKNRKKMNHNLIPVKEGNKILYYGDTCSRHTFIESDIPYNEAKHGLCQKLSRLVLVNRGYPKKVFVSREDLQEIEKQKHRPINVPFQDRNKNKKTWTFESNEISVAKELLKTKNDNPAKTISITLGCPREVAEHLVPKITDPRTLLKTKKREKGVKKNVKSKSIKTTKRRK